MMRELTVLDCLEPDWKALTEHGQVPLKEQPYICLINDTKMILEKCVDCKKCLFSAMKTTKNQGKTVHIISRKCLI